MRGPCPASSVCQACSTANATLEFDAGVSTAAVHNATMTLAHRLALAENLPAQDSAERAFNKLARTFAAQVEALKNYRSKGATPACLPCGCAPWQCAQSQSPPTSPAPERDPGSHRAAARQSAGSRISEPLAPSEMPSYPPRSIPAAACPSPKSGHSRRALRASVPDSDRPDPAPPSTPPVTRPEEVYSILFGSGSAGLGHSAATSRSGRLAEGAFRRLGASAAEGQI